MQEINLERQTIAAVATAVAPGQGGIAVIRLSGPDAQRAVREITCFPGAQLWESHRVLYGHVMAADGVERLDEVLVLLMLACAGIGPTLTPRPIMPVISITVICIMSTV